ERFRPVIVLTDAGWHWLKKQEPAELILDLPPDLLRRIRRGTRARPAAAEPKSPTEPFSAADQTSPERVSTEEWTFRLIDRGFSVAEAAEIRRLERPTIIRHLLSMAQRDHCPPVEKFLPVETIASWDAWRSAHRDATPPADPADFLDLWPLYVACRIRELF
ncbi:MAG: helix-turn-helix domain-containing protein, partial [Isosphaeraceae bacterium]